jgi:hypothetical protein
MTNPNAPDDLPRDEHLRAALRHAPDADRQPPAHLRAQIVAAAHRALDEQPAAPPPPRRWWLPGPLGASGALASVLLAGVLGLIWQGSPPGPAADGPQPAVATAPAPPAAASSAETRQAMRREAPAPDAAAPTITATGPRSTPATPAAPARPAVADATAQAKAMARPAETEAAAPPVPAAAPARSRPAESLSTPGPMAALSPRAEASAAEVGRAVATPLRWRIDGADLGIAPPSWADTAAAADRRFGQPSALSRLPEARRVDLLGSAGGVASLWLTDTQLLWCPADGSACRLSTPEVGLPAALRQALPAVPAAEAAASQPPKRDSR